MGHGTTIDLIIPTLNERDNLPLLLESLQRQAMPPDVALNPLVIDNGSHDGTLDVAAAFGVRSVHNPIRHPEVSKMVGYRMTGGDYFMYLDADIHVNDEFFFQRLLAPLTADAAIAGAFPRFGEHREKNSPLERFLNLDPLQLDPLLRVLCTPIERTIETRRQGYAVCHFDGIHMPPVGICLYRRQVLEDVVKPSDDRFMDIDVPVLLSRAGHHRFAFVPEAVIYHESSQSVREHARKHVRNIGLNMVEQGQIRPRAFVYLRPGDVSQRICLMLWLAGTLTFLPQFIWSLVRIFQTRRWEYIYHAPMAFGATVHVLKAFFVTASGRRALKRMFFRAADGPAVGDRSAGTDLR